MMVPASAADEAGALEASPVLGAAVGLVDGSLGAPQAARLAAMVAAAPRLSASLRRLRRDVTGT